MSKKTPQIRFKGFTDDWEERKLKDVLDISKTKNKAQQYGKVDVLSVSREVGTVNQIKYQGRSFAGSDLSNYKVVQGGELIYTKSPLKGAPYGIFQVATIKGILSPLYAVYTSTDKAYTPFVAMALKNDNIATHYLTPLVAKGAKNTINVTDEGALEGKIQFPSILEQKQIFIFFKQLDDTIALHQRKLDLLKEQKKGFLQKMFPKNGSRVPELRFSGFADDWEERKLSSGLREYTDRVIVEDDKEYYQISVRNNFGGITLRGSKMGNKIGRKRQAKINLTKYPQTLIFTRQTVEQGGIGWVDKYCDGAIVTENMPTISLDTSVFSKYFLTNLFQTRIFYKNAILDNVEGGSAQIAIHESKFLSSTLLFPNLDEQEKIGQFFKQLDDTIDLHQRKLDLLKQQKKGFLQKMFVS
ncbi:restriction endonuclease subunit S [Leuconostoc citreum]|uniref:restriction endonuclease subunit S n=1 Tax=Leuconostoc citreum TaxID=33964 RepID=UPI0021654082|nr:restriction endonuclease subunit S [Leuconostoc citreum]UVW15747.1 restriction endonuclease subunit S [Leuconostoc citreum]